MRSEAAAIPAGLTIRRHFEANRLALACQARAYEQVLSAVGRQSESAQEALSQAEGERVESRTLTTEGAAA